MLKTDEAEAGRADGSERNRTKLLSSMTVYFTQKTSIEAALPQYCCIWKNKT